MNSRLLGPLFVFVLIGCSRDDGSILLNGNPVSYVMDLQTVKVSFDTGTPGKEIVVKLKRNSNTRKVRFAEVAEFLKKDTSYLARYTLDDYDCKGFAFKLYDNAQAEKLEVRFVIMSIRDQVVGHALTAFDTTDLGRVFVDFTPLISPEGIQKPSKRIVWVSEGDPYIRIPLENLPPGFSNTRNEFMAFKDKETQAARQLAEYNKEFDRLEPQKQELQKKMEEFGRRVGSGVPATDYEAVKTEKDRLDRDVNALNEQIDSLRRTEDRIRATFYDFDWVGKDWIINSIKLLP